LRLVWFFFFSHSVAIATGKNRQPQPLHLNSYGMAVIGKAFRIDQGFCENVSGAGAPRLQ
jgi:hypothetical protein